jgi:hypothetical protein
LAERDHRPERFLVHEWDELGRVQQRVALNAHELGDFRHGGLYGGLQQ